MAFYIPNDAKDWFRHIQGKKRSGNGFELDFDIFYFCLMTGLSKSKKGSLPNTDISEIIKYFPKEYIGNRHLIIALFIKTELHLLGISLIERKALDAELKRLISPTSPTSLSDDGMKELNRYAFGGFKVLQEHFPESPRTLDNFLIGFHKLINKK